MEKKRSGGKHFVVVHGACHGAWCWYKVVTLLKSAGHKVSAVDLGASGINPKQLDEIPTFCGYFKPLNDFMAALPPAEKVILVGHSFGGIPVSVAMEKFAHNISVAVFVTAFMLTPDFDLLLLDEQYFTELGMYEDSTFTFDQGPDGPATSILFGPKFLASRFYQLSPAEDLSLCLLLARPFPIYRDEDSKMEAALSAENYGSVRRVYIVSKKDKILTEETQRSIIQNYPPDEVKEIDSSDHMVMFSRPQELFSILNEIADNYT